MIAYQNLTFCRVLSQNSPKFQMNVDVCLCNYVCAYVQTSLNYSKNITFLEIERRANWFLSKAGQRYKKNRDLTICGGKCKKWQFNFWGKSAFDLKNCLYWRKNSLHFCESRYSGFIDPIKNIRNCQLALRFQY